MFMFSIPVNGKAMIDFKAPTCFIPASFTAFRDYLAHINKQ